MAAERTPRQDARLLWLLLGPKAGDNAQVQALGREIAAAGDWRVEDKRLAFHRGELLLHLLSRPTVLGLERTSRGGLRPPWPDLVITAGRRNELVARWIRHRSGNRTRLVHLGRPWSRPGCFDLVVSTPQYALPPGPGVMVNPLPLPGRPPRAGDEARAAWEQRLARLPRPWTAVLVGGNSGPFVFSPDLARDLAQRLERFVASHGGALLVTTSPRTPPAFARRLEQALTVPHYFHRWTPPPADNPYLAFLALADRIAVTAESVSMITEAAATGKPAYLLPAAPRGRPWWLRSSSFRWKPLSHRLAMALAPARFERDVGRIHEALLAAGRVAWLGAGDPPAPGPGEDSLAATARRVRTMVDTRLAT